MTSIYLILVAIFLFIVAINVNAKLEKTDFYKECIGVPIRKFYDRVFDMEKEDYSVIVIDNSDITKPSSKNMEALSLVHDGSTGEIKNGYQTIEASVLSEDGKGLDPVTFSYGAFYNGY